jgi:hypothetical protein
MQYISLSPEEMERLEEAAARAAKSVDEFVRDAIDNFVLRERNAQN